MSRGPSRFSVGAAAVSGSVSYKGVQSLRHSPRDLKMLHIRNQAATTYGVQSTCKVATLYNIHITVQNT